MVDRGLSIHGEGGEIGLELTAATLLVGEAIAEQTTGRYYKKQRERNPCLSASDA